MSDDRARSVSLIVHECTNNTIEKERRVGNRNFWRLCLITSWTRVLMVSWLTSSSFFLSRNVSLLLEWLYWMLDSFGLFLLRKLGVESVEKTHSTILLTFLLGTTRPSVDIGPRWPLDQRKRPTRNTGRRCIPIHPHPRQNHLQKSKDWHLSSLETLC